MDRSYAQYLQVKQHISMDMPEYYQQIFPNLISVNDSYLVPKEDLATAEQPFRSLLVELEGIR